jgi:pimeloyl-ACP methyl ester carboxylesterase
MAREVLAVAADCGFAPVTLVAHSFGAMAAIMAAIAAPERVQRLVIIADAIAAARAPPLHRDAAPLSARRRHRRGQPGRGRLWRDRTFPSPSAARGMTPCCQRRMP